MTGARDWTLHHTAAAPRRLAARVLDLLGDPPAEADVAEALARAGQAALEGVVSRPGDRSVALDLLAADALITLALLARAKDAPHDLGRFAESLLRTHAATP